MTVNFYPYSSQYDGFHVQRTNCTKVFEATKSDIIEKMATPHISTKKEAFDIHSTDFKGNQKKEFELLADLGLMIITR